MTAKETTPALYDNLFQLNTLDLIRSYVIICCEGITLVFLQSMLNVDYRDKASITLKTIYNNQLTK